MKIAIVEDEERWRLHIGARVKAYFTHRALELDTYEDAESFLKAEKFYDGVLMDVELPGMSGFEASQKYISQFPNTEVIILTIHVELGLQGYGIGILRYLDKNRMEEDLTDALDALEISAATEVEIPLPQKDGTLLYAPVDQIRYVESDDRGSCLHLENCVMETTMSIGEMVKVLDYPFFYRCHRSFLINWKYTDDICRNHIRMKGGKEVPISSRKAAEGRNRFQDYRFVVARG